MGNSIINSYLNVDEEHWVVSVVTKGDHAVLVFETVGQQDYPNEGHCISWFDFMPSKPVSSSYDANQEQLQAILAALSKGIEPGVVRCCPGKQQKPLLNIYTKHNQLTTKSKLFAYLGWAEDCTTFRESKDKVELVLASVRSDLNRLPDSSNPLYFRLDGGDGTENGPRNCLTWCIDKLKSGNIDCNQLSRWAVNDILAIRPVNHIGSDRDNCFIL